MTHAVHEERPAERLDFIRQIVADDVATGKPVVTRFPPEPNGFLHIGHAKAICLDFGIAREFGGRCHLRFDDTNPLKEEQRYIDGIKEDLRWLGFDWGEHEYHASAYFDQLYAWAQTLIRSGKAYVCDLSAAEMRDRRGTLTAPGVESPHRNRPIEESLDLFERMKKGEFPDGARTLRAKIDMASPNLNLRDPVMYRILHATHPRTGDAWCIYPTYDWAHGQSDSIEGITHSLCTLEFEDHRPLYDWFLEQLGVHRPRQIEFARLNIERTIVTKRKLLTLVEGGHVRGWDDPRMPTLRGLRRRGCPPEAIVEFCAGVGITKFNSRTDPVLLENAVRAQLNRAAPRVMGVVDPLKVVIENFPEDATETFEAVNNPEDPSAGTRTVPFSRELWIEREDFMEDAPKKFFRLAPGREVRLRSAYFVTCVGVEKDASGNVTELRCTYDPATRGGDSPDGRKVKGTLHWVSARHALDAEVRLYEPLFTKANPEDVEAGEEFLVNLNPESERIVAGAKVEPSLAGARPGDRFQFERIGYFCVDPDATPERLVFNRTATLRETAKKAVEAGQG
ncbi:MAG: glutamine--tRNA ligase/YqeY domain fusion protein [Phycisphaerales bacterium]|nr:glutamine--tRNA ligase/YqeY domain fusion protein [Phycisphaerales bacterium]